MKINFDFLNFVLLSATVLIAFSAQEISYSEEVSMQDPNLASAVQKSLNITPGTTVTTDAMLSLTELYAENSQIRYLTGLEHGHNLRKLSLWNNSISGIFPLSGLTQLTWLNLWKNSILDVSALSRLTQLTWLNLGNNSISNISVLAKLTQLTFLELSNNSISNISALRRLTQLTSLNLSNNFISNISALAELTQLTSLDLSNNSVSSTLALAELTQLTSLNLSNNSISDTSGLVGPTQLTALNLSNNFVSDVSALAKPTQLTSLDLSNNSISDVSALAKLTQLTSLNLSNNFVSDISALVGLTQLKELYLKGNQLSAISLKTHIPEIQANGTTVLFDIPKIEGPWLWIIVPTGAIGGAEAAISGTDYLAKASDGFVTEYHIATNGTQIGNSVGNSVWTPSRIPPTGLDNINDTMNAIGLGEGDIDDHVAYGLITLNSPREQVTTMLVGSDDAVKVWLNGVLVHDNPIDRAADDFQNSFPVILQQGKNILLVAVYERAGDWSGFFGFEIGTEYTVLPPEPSVDPVKLAADVNGDGVVNIQDLVFVSTNFGTGQSSADVNDDGVVNITDLVLVAGALNAEAAGPSLYSLTSLEQFTVADIQYLLKQTQLLAHTDPTYLRGITVLEQLFTLLLPKETALSANYPNPFNPETWIPYQLAKPADVTLTIYDINGSIVQVLDLGYQLPGIYHNRNRAAHWDGRNQFGEPIASGIYFYTFKAGDFSATRKMLIRK